MSLVRTAQPCSGCSAFIFISFNTEVRVWQEDLDTLAEFAYLQSGASKNPKNKKIYRTYPISGIDFLLIYFLKVEK